MRLKKGEIIDTKEYLDSHRALVAKYLQKVQQPDVTLASQAQTVQFLSV